MGKKTYKGYICGTGFECELESTDVKIFPSVASLIRETSCHKECGIVEVKVSLVKWVTAPMSGEEIVKSAKKRSGSLAGQKRRPVKAKITGSNPVRAAK